MVTGDVQIWEAGSRTVAEIRRGFACVDMIYMKRGDIIFEYCGV